MLLPTSLSAPIRSGLDDRPGQDRRPIPAAGAGEELWRVAPEWLDQEMGRATLIAIRDQERAGLDIITDGRAARKLFNRFATALDGVDPTQSGHRPRTEAARHRCELVGKISRRIRSKSARKSVRQCDRPIKTPVPGPFNMAQSAQNDFYEDEAELAHDYAVAVNAEMKDLFAAGADVVQIDEPYMQARPDKARAYGLDALRTALEGIEGRTALHICFGYAALIHERPEGYSFLPELADSPVREISIETAQSNLDCAVLEKLSGKTIILGVLEIPRRGRDTRIVAARIRRACPMSSRSG